MCRFIRVSRSSYYEWLDSSGCAREKEDARLTAMIKLIFDKDRSNYGSRSIKGR